ncbi:thioredoxin-like protein, partial [Jimgerdemannia flammicorona]
CPWAYIASRRIEVITARVGAQIIWTPVLLGGIYEATKAPQDVMPGAKKAVNQKDFVRTLKRFDIPLKYHPKHPVRTVDSVRLLHATPPTHRAALTHALYQLYWVQNADITDRTLLLTTARRLKIPYTQPLDDSLFADTRHHASLRAATADAVRRGAPGVPSFWIPHGDAPDTGLLFWGQDRLHFVEASLAAMRVAADPMAWDTVPRIAEMYPRKATAAQAKAWAGRQRTLTYYYDFSSPWCYLAWTQMERVAREAGKGLKLELVPVLVGGLFR